MEIDFQHVPTLIWILLGVWLATSVVSSALEAWIAWLDFRLRELARGREDAQARRPPWRPPGGRAL